MALLTYALVTGALGLLTYLYYRRKYSYFRDVGIPGPTPLPFFGTSLGIFTQGVVNFDANIREKYGKIAGLYEGGTYALFISDTEVLREVLVKKFHNFTNRREFGKMDHDDIIGNMMTVLRDDKWKRVRSMLTPTFSTGKLKLICQSINECGSLLVENLGQVADSGEEFEMKEYCGAFTLDVIARAAFGIAVNSQEDKDNEFVTNAKKAMDIKLSNPFIVLGFIFPSLIPCLKKLGFSFFAGATEKFFTDVVEQAMEGRKQSQDKSRQDFLQLMINAHKDIFDAEEVAREVAEDGITFDKIQNPQKGLSKVEILAQGFLFFLAGFDTSANTLSLLLYNLAVNPEYQEKVYEEVCEVLGDKDDVSYSDVQSMTYLDQCLQESLRIYSPAPRVDRVAANDITIKGVPIPKDTIVVVPIQVIHMDPDTWPEPEKYNPDRFAPEERRKRDPLDHMPFGYGPRSCIAMRLGLMVVKMAAAAVLKNFKLLTCEKTQIPLKFNKYAASALTAEKGIWLKIVRR